MNYINNIEDDYIEKINLCDSKERLFDIIELLNWKEGILNCLNINNKTFELVINKHSVDYSIEDFEFLNNYISAIIVTKIDANLSSYKKLFNFFNILMNLLLLKYKKK